MSKSLVAFDTDKIKGYVFATGKLKEIRGASALLDHLNRVDMVHLAGGECIYANGGSGLFVVNSEKVSSVLNDVQRVYHDATHAASITGVSAEIAEDGSNDISAELDLSRQRLRAAKNSRATPTLQVTHALFHFCDSCGVDYATVAGEEGKWLCQSCALKRKKDERVKVDIRRWADSPAKLDPDSPHLWERLLQRLYDSGYPVEGYDRPEDFESLGAQSSPNGYLGLIYADGDGMGREIEQIRSLDEMRRFARVVDDAIYQAVTEAISTHLRPAQSKDWPFDILLLGGDDLVMVTRAQSAIEVALRVVERFPEITGQKWNRPLSLSASVVLAHVNYPIGSLLRLAESGLKFAKKSAAQRKRSGETLPGGLLNFLVVSSANHLDFGDYYQQLLEQEERIAGPVLYRTQRPYTAPEMYGLLDQLKSVNKVPRTKLEQLRAAVFESRQQGGIDTMMAVLRSREGAREALLKLFGTTPEQQLTMPWLPKGHDWVTPVLDIVELLDFVGKEGNA